MKIDKTPKTANCCTGGGAIINGQLGVEGVPERPEHIKANGI